VTCSGKLSMILEYTPAAVETAAMEKIRDKVVEYFLS
jgi:hypothetical protein